MRICLVIFILMAATLRPTYSQSLSLTDAQAMQIGQRIWKNECAGTVDGLTSWNKGEEFASLGIGHFIWYPKGKKGPFKESFPELVRFLESQKIKIPAWMKGACPWESRNAFEKDFQSGRMKALRSLLKNSVGLQARFAALRLETALPEMLKSVPQSEHEKIRAHFYRVASTPEGLYALMDYVNFKGEGTSLLERYHGEGWGLLQVLQTMDPQTPALSSFSKAAENVLRKRLENSPSERGEARWLAGWTHRVKSYAP